MKQLRELKVVECKGTPFEIGMQYGESCRDDIKKSLEMNLYGLLMAYQSPKQKVLSMALKFLPKVQEFDPYLIEFLEGQAKGAGLSFDEVFTLRCMSELMVYHNQITALCTSFAATGSATENGKTILGQTIDWAPETPVNLLKIHRPDGSKQLTLILGSWVEYTLSSAGFGICANATFGMDYSFNIPLGCYLPKVMRQPNLSDAVNILQSVARGLGYYHLASADGEIVGIESTHDDYEIMKAKEDVIIHSNHYLTERFMERDMVNMAVPDSPCRLERFRKLITEQYGKLNHQLMMDIFRDHENHPHSICSHVDLSKAPALSETLASFVMIPEDKVMYIANGNPCSTEYLLYEL